MEEESGKRKLKHPEEVQMGQISDVLDQIEAIMFDKGVEQGEKSGSTRVNRLNAELIKDDRTAELFQATQDPELQEKLMIKVFLNTGI